MKLVALIICLSSLVSHVVASNLAGKYQWVFLWYAYRMNVQAYNSGLADMLISVSCVGTVGDPAKSCYLDEFLEWNVDPDRQGFSWDDLSYTRNLDLNIDSQTISVEDLANEIYEAGYGREYVDITRISPLAYPDDKVKTFDKIYNSVLNNIQTIRQKLGKSDVGKEEFKRTKEAIGLAIEGRIEENLSDTLKALEPVVKDSGFTLEYNDDGTIDYAATKATNSDDGVKWQTVVKNFVNENWVSGDDVTTRRKLLSHMHVIANCQHIASELAAPLPC